MSLRTKSFTHINTDTQCLGIKNKLKSSICNSKQFTHNNVSDTIVYSVLKYIYTLHILQDLCRFMMALCFSRQPKLGEEIKAQMEETEIKPTDIHNLQKTVSGGVLLIELSFRQEYFCVKLYTCDHNKLGITVNQQVWFIE